MSEAVGIAFTPEDFTAFAKTRDEVIVLGINIGLEIEGRSRSFYQSILKNLPPVTTFILKFLANEELDHIKTLLTFKTALQNNDRWIELNPKHDKTVVQSETL